jgi:GT2 family glycosyltransferase
MKSITIIIPNYNGAEILPQNLPIVEEYAKKYNAQIIVVDDASKDNSIEVLSQMPNIYTQKEVITDSNRPLLSLQRDKINLIKKAQNQGFSSTVNIGVHYAQTELVCLLNSDVIPSVNFLDPVLAHFENNPQLFGVGMRDLSDDEAEHGRGKFIFHRGFMLHQRQDNADAKLESGETGWVSCGSGVFSKKIWDELGGLDEILNPFYFEDVDLGYRAWKAGYSLYFEYAAIVEHVHKKGAIKSNYKEGRIREINYRNQILFNWKNLSDKKLKTKHLLMLPVNCLIELKNGNATFFKGLYGALKKLPQLGNAKYIKTKDQKRTDTQILNLFKNNI